MRGPIHTSLAQLVTQHHPIWAEIVLGSSCKLFRPRKQDSLTENTLMIVKLLSSECECVY